VLELAAWAYLDVASGLLMLAGAIKLAEPDPWVDAFGILWPGASHPGRPTWRGVARAVGAGEIGLAGWFWGAEDAVPLALLTMTYVAFTAVAAVFARRDNASCGCFGRRSAPISTVHVVLNGSVVVVGLVALFESPTALADRLGPGVGSTVAYLVFLALGTALTAVAMTTAAELSAIRRRVEPAAAPSASVRT